jgi:signal transduction histidine kinase
MPVINRSALHAAMPRLRANFEHSRALVVRARERASRTAAHAQAMRMLLESYSERPSHAAVADREIWEAAAETVVRAATERDRALGMLAHELRQPLAAALAAHRLLAMHPATPIAERAAGVLDRQLLHLSKLVDSLLDFSRLTLGTVALEHKEVDLRDVIGRAVEACDAAAMSRAHRIAVSIAPARIPVCGDATRLFQVFSNLLDNAVRYTPAAGAIAIAAEIVAGAVHVAVTDSGAGIAADLQPRIFDPFTRGSRDGLGLGVGLALARTIVELHGGSIDVASDGPGEGSAFTVVLPLLTPQDCG